MSYTFRDFEESVCASVRDALGYLDDSDLAMMFRDGDFDAFEIADGCIPVYYAELCDVCLDGGLMNVEPEIGEAKSPAQMMQFVLFEEAERIAHEEFGRFREDEEDEASRFRAFLGRYGEPWELVDGETAYDLWTDAPRRNVDEWGDDPDFYEAIWKEWSEEKKLHKALD